MNVMLVSQCSKQALPATRRILDQFAERKGMRTWLTPITEAGLETLHDLLRRGARRNTAVACHLVRGGEIELLWIVGNRRQFDRKGNVPTDTSSSRLLERYREDAWRHTESIALLAAIAGLFHDFGKANELFQRKLEGSRSSGSEPWRHEWLSVRLFEAFVGDRSDKEWLESLAEVTADAEASLVESTVKDKVDKHRGNPLRTLADRPLARAVAWLIATHHRLPAPRRHGNPARQHRLKGHAAASWIDNFSPGWITPARIDDDKTTDEDWRRLWRFPNGLPLRSTTWLARAATMGRRALAHTELSSEDWMARPFVLHIARCSLMLADHHYSSGPATEEWQDKRYRAYANTDRIEDTASASGFSRVLKQKLDEHCIGVSHDAFLIAKSLPGLRAALPAVGDVRALRRPSKGLYSWQNRVYALAERTAESSRRQGGFFIDMASTGTGKTLANARMAFGLSTSDDGCRFTVLLGLRTLTLQTADALRQRTGLASADLATMVGSAAVRELHERRERAAEPDSVTGERDTGSESAYPLFAEHEYVRYEGALDASRVGQWLRREREGSTLHRLISAPVVVGTIDHVMPATESARGGGQIAPMLRLLTSDIVLDEPDDFDLSDQPALCRLVHWVGLLGSRVVLSSATLPPSLLGALFDAYRAGRQEFNRATAGTELPIVCGWMDEFSARHEQVADGDAFRELGRAFVDRRLARLEEHEKPRRLARLAAVEVEGDVVPLALARVVRREIETLHEHHGELSPAGNHRVSVGIVRMANIDPLVAVARAMAEAGSAVSMDIHLCVYHAHHPLYRRARIEQELDTLLDRRNPAALWDHPSVRSALEREARDQVFVVLATAVAEVGRDHDYHWAVVEPSSMRSIVQLAGRVLRHRVDQVPRHPNIVLLRRNMTALRGQTPAFTKPGYESEALPLRSHDLDDVLGPEHYARPNAASRIREAATLDFEHSLVDLEHEATRRKLDGDPDTFPASLWWKTPIDWCYALQAHTRFREGRPTVHYALTTDTVDRPAAFELFSEGEWVPRSTDFGTTSLEPGRGVHLWPWLPDDVVIRSLADDGDGDALQSRCRRYLGLSLDAPYDDAGPWLYHWWLGVHRLLKW